MHKRTNMKKVQVEKQSVRGLKIRTKNSDEMNQKTQKIGPLWGTFQDNIYPKIERHATIYSVYSNYESDMKGEFDVLLGADIMPFALANETVEIQEGEYLVFEVTGDLPQGIIETWGKIWEYFSDINTKEKRAYQTDFERYTFNDEVHIYIGIN